MLESSLLLWFESELLSVFDSMDNASSWKNSICEKEFKNTCVSHLIFPDSYETLQGVTYTLFRQILKEN